MSESTMLDVFQQEVEAQIAILNQGFISLKTEPQSGQKLEPLMRVVNAIQGTARLVEIDAAINLAQIIENCLDRVQKQSFILGNTEIDVLLEGVDLLFNISHLKEETLESWILENQENIDTLTNSIDTLLTSSVQSVSQPKVEFKSLPTKSEIPSLEVGLEDDSKSQQITVSPNIPAAIKSSPISNPEEIGDEQVTVTKYSQDALELDEISTIGDTSMVELFKLEVEAQAAVLSEGLLALESQPGSPKVLESLMRAAHSVKGAARIVALDAAVNLAHVMEDCFVAAQNQKITLEAEGVDVLLHGVDLLTNISQQGQIWVKEYQQDIETTREEIYALLTPGNSPVQRTQSLPSQQKNQGQTIGIQKQEIVVATPGTIQTQPKTENKFDETNSIINPISGYIDQAKLPAADSSASDRVVRVSAENLNRIMGLAGESLIEANWLQPFADSLTILKKRQLELSKILEVFQQNLTVNHHQDTESYLEAARTKERECRQILNDRLIELELYARRTSNLSDRLYQEVIQSNMRPFADGVQGFPRMIRDLARKLNKQVKFEIIGKSTPVDRDIIKKLEAPLTHILRNSIDHGLELPEERIAAGKPAEGTVRLEAVHRGGMLSITITDNGRGINFDWLRQKILNKNLATPEIVAQLSESELMEFLFLPGFSTAKQVTEISGRGVGLDIAKSMAHEVGGTVRASSTLGKGTTFHFQLPLTLSVVRTLLVEISGEPYAFPLARIEQIVNVNKEEISSVENRQYFTMDNKNIGLVAAYQVLELKQPPPPSNTLSVVVISEQSDYYGLVVDRFLGEHDLVVRPLDPQLGKVQDISAAALMGDGSPILIVDASDLMRSVDNLLNNSQLNRVINSSDKFVVEGPKSILVVDDSITVREMQRKLLQNKGYNVDVAVDGMEGWHAVSTNHYDLVISDVDMPRMNGIEFTTKIKNNPKFSSIPVIIVSYKDREEDRIRGLEAGADYYLTKASFQDDTLVNAVYDLIGH
ncbi:MULTISPECIES: response regulator [Kamptonema]|uniref:response regulator n=1 Tax=Kamptonema TaxID=1501433 RepID=UPI0001DACA50|nr:MULTISPECIES: response regulator [Kamptonema]CBN53895.1 CheA signal transduction histidine kinase (modular protein) [Kamptonema sp. PCC 6506]